MDRTLKTHNDAVIAYRETKGKISLVSFGRCSEAYKRAFMRKWQKLEQRNFPFLKTVSYEKSNII